MQQVASQLALKRTQQPRTILSFFAIILGLVIAGAVGVIVALSSSGRSTYLIPIILIGLLLLFVGVVGMVIWLAIHDPSKLMLGQVTGTEYVAIQQHVVLGDSLRGERVELIPTASLELESAEIQQIEVHASEPGDERSDI